MGLGLLIPAPEISNLSIRSCILAGFDENMWRTPDDPMDFAAWEDASPGPAAAIRPRMTTSARRYALQVEVRLAVWLACEMLVARAYPPRQAFVGCCGDETVPASEGHGLWHGSRLRS